MTVSTDGGSGLVNVFAVLARGAVDLASLRVTSKQGIIPGQKSSSRTLPLTSSKPVSGQPRRTSITV